MMLINQTIQFYRHQTQFNKTIMKVWLKYLIVWWYFQKKNELITYMKLKLMWQLWQKRSKSFVYLNCLSVYFWWRFKNSGRSLTKRTVWMKPVIYSIILRTQTTDQRINYLYLRLITNNEKNVANAWTTVTVWCTLVNYANLPSVIIA